jgi:hypothetical protein
MKLLFSGAVGKMDQLNVVAFAASKAAVQTLRTCKSSANENGNWWELVARGWKLYRLKKK